MNDRKALLGSAIASLVAFARLGVARAQDDGADVASAGNGGTATANANGGAVSVGDVNSGGNAGPVIGVGDTWDGSVAVDGGSVTANTTIGISADGGVAVSDASGGDFNTAATIDLIVVGEEALADLLGVLGFLS